MTTSEIVEYLHNLAEATENVANSEATGRVSHARLLMQAAVLVEACEKMMAQQEHIDSLRDRLVKQASFLERLEASCVRKTWPLLEDDDDPGMSP